MGKRNAADEVKVPTEAELRNKRMRPTKTEEETDVEEAEEQVEAKALVTNVKPMVAERSTTSVQAHSLQDHALIYRGLKYVGQVPPEQHARKGVFTSVDERAVYTGEYSGDCMHGVGEMEFDKNVVPTAFYIGEWEKGRRAGHGVQTWYNKDKELILTYLGQFNEEEKREGHSVFRWPNGRVYWGQCVNGKKEGYGVEERGGKVYSGKWIADQRAGYGVERLPDGRVYSGEWKEGRRDGHGVEYHHKRQAYCGLWKAGKRDRYGVACRADGVVYKGQFNEGKLNGLGIMYSPPGESKRRFGRWEQDAFIEEMSFNLRPVSDAQRAKARHESLLATHV